MRKLTICTAAALLLAGCSEPTTTPADEATVAVPEVQVEPLSVIEAGAAPGSQSAVGAPIELVPLQGGDGAAIEGELGCSFGPEGAEQTLFLGMGIVDVDEAPQGLVRTTRGLVQLTGTQAAGFAGMTRGGVFTGDGLTISISRGGEIPDDTEATKHRATLEVRPPSGGVTRYDGVWTCGP